MTFELATLWPQGDMPRASLCGDAGRLAVLAAHGMEGLYDDPELERIVALAAQLCAAPIALVSLVAAEEQVFVARAGLEARSTARSLSFCAHAMLGAEAMVVPDAAQDPRFAGNALVLGPPHIRFYAGQPLISSEGAPLGSLCVIDTVPRPEGLTALQRQSLVVLAEAAMRRLSQQRQGDAAVAEIARREAQLRRMIDSVPGIAFSADDSGRFDYFNAQWAKMTGEDPPETAAQWAAYVHPADYALSFDRWRRAVAARTPYEDRWRLKRAGGGWRWVLARVVPLATDDGQTQWFGALIDIEDAQREAEARELLAHELSHRIKNIFAVISGLISTRSRGREDVAPFADEITAAIRALGVAHDHVRPDSGRRSDRLTDLLGELLVPYDTRTGGRIQVTGTDLALGAQAATPLALIFHELATNSAKYGALSHPEGRVAVHVHPGDAAADTVRIDWLESIPHAARPQGDSAASGPEGFGSRLLRMAIEGQLRGRFERELTPLGLSVRIELPVSSLAPRDAAAAPA